jgi:hypothetical protein
MISSNLGKFLKRSNVFQDIFSHNELIKRSFPLLRFLYKQEQFEDVVGLLKMVEGKHEASANAIYRLLNDLAEILTPKDLQLVIDEVCTIKEIDSNILNLIKAIGRNDVFNVNSCCFLIPSDTNDPSCANRKPKKPGLLHREIAVIGRRIRNRWRRKTRKPKAAR